MKYDLTYEKQILSFMEKNENDKTLLSDMKRQLSFPAVLPHLKI